MRHESQQGPKTQFCSGSIRKPESIFTTIESNTIELFVVTWQKYVVLVSGLEVECMNVAVKVLLYIQYLLSSGIFFEFPGYFGWSPFEKIDPQGNLYS
jgi:hypothetical protein